MALKSYEKDVLSQNFVTLKVVNDPFIECVTIGTDELLPLLSYLQSDEHWQMHSLMDICGVDYPEKELRFEIVYHLLSITLNRRFRIKLRVAQDELVPSATSIFPSANWYEREVWDMFGVHFSDHPDHRRILTDYGFEGHPLRKDFPVTGEVEVRYDEEQQRIVSEPISLVQDFRRFDFLSPWQAMLPEIDRKKKSNAAQENETPENSGKEN